MSHFTLRGFFRVLLAMLVAATHVHAQSARPGGSTRSTASSARTSTTRGNTGSSGASRSGSGQRQYRSNTELGDAIITIDPETRSLVIVTDEDTHRELKSVIQNLDQPKPQVLIKVVFVEVTYNKGIDVGLDGMYTFRLKDAVSAITGTSTTNSTRTTTDNGTLNTNASGTGTTFTGTNGTTGNSTVTSTLTSALGTAAKVGETAAISSLFGAPATGSLLKFASDDWNLTLHALATKGKVDVLSRPSIMARNNQEAVIVVGQEVPFITNSRTDSLGQTINTIQYDNVGIILRVTPFINPDRSVEMIVAPEISSLNKVDTVPISNTVNAPTIDKRSAETVVVTPNGQTVVIGGLMQTQKSESVSKIPFLGDIPILGIPFRRTIRDDRKRELLIFLTPYIVNDRQSLAQTASDEMAKITSPEKAFTRKEFDAYRDDLPLPTDGAQGSTRAPVATEVTVKKVTKKATPPPRPLPKRP